MPAFAATPRVVSRRSVNLLGADMRAPTRLRKIQNIARRTSIVLLVVYVFCLTALFAVNFMFSRQEAGLLAENTAFTAEIKKLSVQEGLLQSVKNRAVLAREIISTSPSTPGKLLFNSTSDLPLGVEVVEVVAQEGKMLITLSVPDIATLSLLLAGFSAERFSGVELDSLALTSKGTYTVSLNVK